MRKIIFAIILVALVIGCGQKNYLNETSEEKKERMEWWSDAKFGMFVHWGVYSVPAGWYKNEMYPNASEWLMDFANIPIEEYEKFAIEFNPTEYDPSEWVRIAKQAGMKYIVITSKHHDGFSLWDSKVANYDIVDFTPYKKDLLKPLADACKKEGIKLGFYYSIMDWHHPDAVGASFPKYRDEYLIPQLEELLNNFPDLSILWFDGEWIDEWTEEQGKDLYNHLRNISPNLIINNRIGKGREGMQGMNKDADAVGDFGTPEQEILESSSDFPWEACMTFNDSWGYKKGDDNWKSAKTIIFDLIDIASKGGNYLLNVGPDSKGVIPKESVERLEKVGNWIEINGEGIYNTKDIKNYVEGDNIKYTKSKNTHHYYSFMVDPPKTDTIKLKYILPKNNSEVILLGYQNKLKYSIEGNTAEIILPSDLEDNSYPICIKIEGIEQSVAVKPILKINGENAEGTHLFQNSVEIELAADSENSEIRYTTDGTIPNMNSHIYSSKIIINESATINAVVFEKNLVESSVSKVQLYKIKSVNDLQLKNSSSEKYPGFGKLALVDGKRGSEDYNDHSWLGFEGKDFEAIIDLGKNNIVNNIYLGCLSNINSWIFLPKKVTFYTSSDNLVFDRIYEFNYEVKKTDKQGAFIKDISAAINSEVRFIKIIAENINECPIWHKGSGGKAWLFIDEIFFD